MSQLGTDPSLSYKAKQGLLQIPKECCWTTVSL